MAAPFRAPTPLPGYYLPLDRRPSTEHNVVAAYLLESLGGDGRGYTETARMQMQCKITETLMDL